MNKDVIYIEPEEDITDIIAKIEGSKSKIVALVPPKKAGVFRSIVNIKLITKSAAGAGKTVVLVTTDPSVIKLAAATKMPVTKDLKTAPEIPETDDEIEESETVDVDDDGEDIESTDSDTQGSKENEEEPEAEEVEEEVIIEEDEDEGGDKDEEETTEKVKSAKNNAKNSLLDDSEIESLKKSEKADKHSDKKKKEKTPGKLASSNNPVLRWIGTHKKADVAIGIGLVALIIFGIWAFAIAPAVTITLELETVTGNFSENVNFTQTLADENITEGKFYIEEKKTESKSEVEFEATGKKNVGEKASGTLVGSYYFPVTGGGGTIAIKSGAVFTNSGLNYIASSDASIYWDGDVTSADKDCKNYKKEKWAEGYCRVSTTISVVASEPGTNYNIAASSSGWSTSISGLVIASESAMSGGSDKTVTIVQQSDIDKALESLKTDGESVNKEKLKDSIEGDVFAIDSSFKQTTSDPVSTPKVGEEVAEGKKAKLTVTTTDSIFVIDATKLIEFIEEKAKLNEGFKIYEMNDPFIENFTKTDDGYIGKLKTSYVAGSTITENEVVDTVKGKGIGTAKRDLSDNFNGIKSITIDTSVPWVTSVPGDTNKITVKIDTKE